MFCGWTIYHESMSSVCLSLRHLLQRNFYKMGEFYLSQLEITCSNLAIETLEQGVKYVQS